MTGCTRKTTHTIALGSPIGARPDAQSGGKIQVLTAEAKPISENGTTLFRRNTVQKTGCGTEGFNVYITPAQRQLVLVS